VTVQEITHLLFAQLDLDILTVNVSNRIYYLLFPSPPEIPHRELNQFVCLWVEVRVRFVDR